MIRYLAEQWQTSRTFKVLTLIFTIFAVWWITIYFRGLTDSQENTYFTISYCILALYGGLAGWSFAKKWGGFRSTLGSSIAFLTLGLFTQFLGQVLYNSYIYFLGVELPYPSIGDISFFASVIFYILGAIQLARVSGIKVSFKTITGQIQVILIPLAILFLTYWVMLSGYEPDWSDRVVTFLDFGFPIGQAIFVSIALLALFISKDILGGMMRRPVILLVIALIAQYIADFHFSWEVSRELWYAAGVNDLLFALSYFLMSIALLSIGNMFYKVKES